MGEGKVIGAFIFASWERHGHDWALVLADLAQRHPEVLHAKQHRVLVQCMRQLARACETRAATAGVKRQKTDSGGAASPTEEEGDVEMLRAPVDMRYEDWPGKAYHEEQQAKQMEKLRQLRQEGWIGKRSFDEEIAGLSPLRTDFEGPLPEPILSVPPAWPKECVPGTHPGWFHYSLIDVPVYNALVEANVLVIKGSRPPLVTPSYAAGSVSVQARRPLFGETFVDLNRQGESQVAVTEVGLVEELPYELVSLIFSKVQQASHPSTERKLVLLSKAYTPLIPPRMESQLVPAFADGHVRLSHPYYTWIGVCQAIICVVPAAGRFASRVARVAYSDDVPVAHWVNEETAGFDEYWKSGVDLRLDDVTSLANRAEDKVSAVDQLVLKNHEGTPILTTRVRSVEPWSRRGVLLSIGEYISVLEGPSQMAIETYIQHLSKVFPGHPLEDFRGRFAGEGATTAAIEQHRQFTTRVIRLESSQVRQMGAFLRILARFLVGDAPNDRPMDVVLRDPHDPYTVRRLAAKRFLQIILACCSTYIRAGPGGQILHPFMELVMQPNEDYCVPFLRRVRDMTLRDYSRYSYLPAEQLAIARDALFIHRPTSFWGEHEPLTDTRIDFPVSLFVKPVNHVSGIMGDTFFFSPTKFQTLLELETATSWDDFLPEFLRRMPAAMNVYIEEVRAKAGANQ
jgi:hypothetical protein